MIMSCGSGAPRRQLSTRHCETRQQFVFAIPADAGPISIIAFAEDAASGEVLQALSLPFCARS